MAIHNHLTSAIDKSDSTPVQIPIMSSRSGFTHENVEKTPAFRTDPAQTSNNAKLEA